MKRPKKTDAAQSIPKCVTADPALSEDDSRDDDLENQNFRDSVVIEKCRVERDGYLESTVAADEDFLPD